jgi:hypothetical protein
MTLPNWTRAVASKAQSGTTSAEATADPQVESPWVDLVQEEDQKLRTINPAHELRRRACPSGE